MIWSVTIRVMTQSWKPLKYLGQSHIELILTFFFFLNTQALVNKAVLQLIYTDINNMINQNHNNG